LIEAIWTSRNRLGHLRLHRRLERQIRLRRLDWFGLGLKCVFIICRNAGMDWALTEARASLGNGCVNYAGCGKMMPAHGNPMARLCLGQQSPISQDVQKVRPARPQRVKG
jgi:hypothetical protein